MAFFTRALFIFASVACLGMSGCAVVPMFIDNDISNEPRFKNVAGREVLTRKKLYLYAPDNRRPAELRHVYDLDPENIGHAAAIIPAGHAVKVTKMVRQHNIGDGAEYLFGEVTLKGTTYPLKYFLGLTSRPNDWREIHQMFVIKE